MRDGTEGLHSFAWGSVVVGGPLDEGSEVDQRLACGAAIACRLRGAVREQLGTRPRTTRMSWIMCLVFSSIGCHSRDLVGAPRSICSQMHQSRS